MICSPHLLPLSTETVIQLGYVFDPLRLTLGGRAGDFTSLVSQYKKSSDPSGNILGLLGRGCTTTEIQKRVVSLLHEAPKENTWMTDEGSLAASVGSSFLMPLSMECEHRHELGVKSETTAWESMNQKQRVMYYSATHMCTDEGHSFPLVMAHCSLPKREDTMQQQRFWRF